MPVPLHPSSAIRLIQGDCLDVLPSVPRGSVDLIYLDPPFNTGRPRSGRAGAFTDCWPDMASYLGFIRPRVVAALHTLTSAGAILLHCDWRTCHHLRLLLDELLGPDRFINHLIWRYGLGGSSPRRFARKHDDILYYAGSDAYYFAPPRVPATSRRMAGQDKKATDVLDIPALNNLARERTGYPTQKPLALLTLLIEACCPPGGTVLDPFCGSGTALVAARSSGRQAIGIDSSARAIAVTRSRLSLKPAPAARSSPRRGRRS